MSFKSGLIMLTVVIVGVVIGMFAYNKVLQFTSK